MTASLLGAVALLASLAFGTASAAAAPPTVTTTVEPGYISAKFNSHFEVPSGKLDFVIIEIISSKGEPEDYWHQEVFSPPSEPGTSFDDSFEVSLAPDTTYEYKVVLVGHFDSGNEEVFFFPQNPPYETFTTGHVNSPIVTLDSVTGLTPSSAQFSGTVDANAPAGPLLDNGQGYETKWRFECEPECFGGGSAGVVKGGEGTVPVAFEPTELEGNTPYQVKLIATNAGGLNETVAEGNFVTPIHVPAVRTGPGASDGKGGYTIEGIVNPLGSKVTDCHFEYGPTASYVFQAPCSPSPSGIDEIQEVAVDAPSGDVNFTFRGQTTGDIPWTTASTPDQHPSAAEFKAVLEGLSTIGSGGISSVAHESGGPYVVTFGGPLGEANLPKVTGENTNTDPQVEEGRVGSVNTTVKVEGGNSAPITVEASLTGLTPGATYHFQLVATNAAGTASSGDNTFVPTLNPEGPPCPNEDLRQENSSLALPECRAYEQITAPDKSGYPARYLGAFGGSSLLYASTAGNIENSGMGGGVSFGNYYVANRTASGWKTIPNLNGPTGSLYAGPEALVSGKGVLETEWPLVYSQDLQSSYWMTHQVKAASPDREPFLRGPDGHFTQIGTTNPGWSPGYSFGVEVIGATPDFSRMVVDGGGAVTPYGPGKYGQGVYEIVGTGTDAPRRVDLDAADQPVSECSVGAQGLATSRNVHTIFFLAFGGCGAAGPATNEIWARVGGGTPAATSYEVSESRCTRPDCNAPISPQFQGAAGDGSDVFFTTTQQLVNEDTDEGVDLYVYRLATASQPSALMNISDAPGGAGVNPEEVFVSEDGSTAMFVATGVLANNEDALGDVAKSGENNVYVWRSDAEHPAGQVSFVGHLRTADLSPGFHEYKPQMTADGRYVILSTASRLVPNDTDKARDVYRYDTVTGALIRLSTSVSGTGGNVNGADAVFTQYSNDDVYGGRWWNTHDAISDDGQAVVFETTGALSPLDGNGAKDIYLWNNGHVFLISSGSAGFGSEKGRIDGSGQDIYFSTRDALTPSDGDAILDVYDARVNGGFSFPEAPVCSGEACQPSGAGAPPSPGPATSQSRAPEAGPRLVCPKGKVLKKGKCTKKPVKKHGKKKHKQDKRGAKGEHGGSK